MNEVIAQKVAEAFAKYPERKYEKGQILVYAGEEPRYIMYLLEGRVREYDITYRGDEVVVNVFQPGAFFPMSWAMNREASKYFYRAEDAVRYRAVPVEDALDFIKSNPDVLYELLSRVYRGADVLIGRLVQLMSGTAKSRLIYELANEAGKAKTDDKEILLHLSEADLAARAGMSRETISREMQKLKDEGLASMTKQGVRIEDLEKLRSKLDG